MNRAWALLVSLIARTAKQKDRVPQWRLECIFEVGDGSGRVWRSWASGSRVPSRSRQRFVVHEAFNRGWVTPTERQLLELLALPNETIYSLLTAPSLVEDPPDPPDRLLAYKRVGGAYQASAALIRDAEFGIARERCTPDRPAPRRKTSAFKTDETAVYRVMQKEFHEECLLATRWKKTVTKVNELITTHDREVVQVALAVAYRKRGYP